LAPATIALDVSVTVPVRLVNSLWPNVNDAGASKAKQ